MRSGPAFDVQAFGEKWAVVSGPDVLVITRTRDEADALAEAAAATLMTGTDEPHAAPQRPVEARSFTAADSDRDAERRRAFGFPVADLRTWS